MNQRELLESFISTQKEKYEKKRDIPYYKLMVAIAENDFQYIDCFIEDKTLISLLNSISLAKELILLKWIGYHGSMKILEAIMPLIVNPSLITVFYGACKRNQVNTIRYIKNELCMEELSAGINEACNFNCWDLVEYLVMHCNRVPGPTIYHASINNKLDIVKILINKPLDEEYIRRSIVEVSKLGYYEILKLLLEKSSLLEEPEKTLNMALEKAKEASHYEVMELLLSKGGRLILNEKL